MLYLKLCVMYFLLWKPGFRCNLIAVHVEFVMDRQQTVFFSAVILQITCLSYFPPRIFFFYVVT